MRISPEMGSPLFYNLPISLKLSLHFAGIIPNSFAHIFGHIAKAVDNIKFLVRVSYLEIYNEEVRDLLGKDQSLRLEVKERPGKYDTFVSFFCNFLFFPTSRTIIQWGSEYRTPKYDKYKSIGIIKILIVDNLDAILDKAWTRVPKSNHDLNTR